MSLVSLNPVAWAKKGLEKGLRSLTDPHLTTLTTPVPGVPTPTTQPLPPAATVQGANTPQAGGDDGTIYANGEPVRGRFVDDQAQPSDPTRAAARRTQEFARTVNTFDEDKLSLLARVVSLFFMTMAYLVPLGIGYFAGAALGDTISGTFSLVAGARTIYTHFLSIVLELSVPMLGYAVAVTFKRAAKDRGQLTLCAVLSVLFLLLAIGNALTQDVLLYHLLPQTTPDERVSVWFRSFGPSIFDILATIFISIVGVRNLKKYLADQREKIHATREVNLIHIEMDKTTLQAEIDRQSAIMDMQSKQQRSTTWNEIEAMQSKSMIEQAKRNMLEGPDNGSSYRRNRY
jgi:hypothetical protein